MLKNTMSQADPLTLSGSHQYAGGRMSALQDIARFTKDKRPVSC